MNQINTTALAKLKAYNVPRTYRVSASLGAACFLDPPGYPSYHLQAVYTSHGNTPPKGPYHVIKDDDVWRAIPEEFNLANLWEPLAIDHERTQMWICALRKHMRSMYYDNAMWVRTVRKHYPDFMPSQATLEIAGNVPYWWETEESAPNHDACKPRSCGPHPVNGTWCQWCGWTAPVKWESED